MTLGERIAEQHRRAYHGEAWHGPAVFELLEGVSAAKAAERPIAKAHSIWEIVLHLTSWETIVRSRMVGEPMDVSPVLDWPPPPAKPAKKSWDEVRAALHEASEALNVVLARMTEAKLLSVRPETRGTYEELAHGQVQHALYHAGQIALLKKGATRAARR
ncbi:MAG TPA: DinB family protein [Candidatus Eisenbacteria bacterium]|nr:DinB family protein [Candidatus Eisenbacteria bacterium]